VDGGFVFMGADVGMVIGLGVAWNRVGAGDQVSTGGWACDYWSAWMVVGVAHWSRIGDSGR